MKTRSVQDVMTRDVVTVDVDAPYKQVAQLLADKQISGLPVVDTAGHVLGVVSEADLLAKAEYPDREPRPRRRLSLPGPWQTRRKAGAGTVGEMMTAPAITIEERTSIVRAAREMDRHRVKRLPVVDEVGRLVGILSRRDLLKIFLRSDEDIREEIETEVLEQSLSISPPAVTVTVADGVVTLEGTVERKTLIPVVIRLTSAVDGVVDVVDRLAFDLDDTKMTEVTYDYRRDRMT